MDHSKFEYMTKGLTRKAIIENLIEDFEMLDQFQLTKSKFPHVSCATCVDLELLIKEMVDYEMPTHEG